MNQSAERALYFVCDEIDKIVDMGELNKDSLMCLKELADIKKDLVTAMAMEEGMYSDEGAMMDENASMSGYSRRSYGSYTGNSYARGRDSMGRYTSRDNGSYRYSRDAEPHTREVLQRYLNEANTEEERSLIHRIMNSI